VNNRSGVIEASTCRVRAVRSGHRVFADIGVGPAVKAALLHPDQKVGGQIVAEIVAPSAERLDWEPSQVPSVPP
jgi:hypothetical protein